MYIFILAHKLVPAEQVNLNMEDIKMKKLFTLLLSLSILSASANRGLSELNVKLFDNSAFSVIMDNINYNYITSSYNFSYLVPGNHNLIISKSLPSNWYGGAVIDKIIFKGSVIIPANVKILSMIAFDGSLVILSQTQLLGADDSPYTSDNSDAGNVYEGSPDYYSNAGSNYGGTTEYYSPCISEMNLISLVSVINSSTFESSKILIAKQAISSNYFFARQVKQLLSLFTFESSKLEIAKLAYLKTLDKGNFFLVNDAFTFESSIDELNEFILGQ
jgi:hypothetical protein